MLHFLSQLPFFKQLPSWLNKRLTAEINLRMLRKGDVVCYQGDEGSEFFVILTGGVSVHVLKDNVKLALLRARKDWDGGSTDGDDLLGSEWGATVATLSPAILSAKSLSSRGVHGLQRSGAESPSSSSSCTRKRGNWYA